MAEFKYSWRDGALVKIDPEGNIMGATHVETVSRNETSHYTWPTTSVSQTQPSSDVSDVMEDVSQQSPTIASEALPTIDENTRDEPKSPEKPIFNKDDLAKRDREAVAYSKALLIEGDTLVYITYPGDSKCFDSTGFEISGAPHRVHSSRLLATGSKVFAKLLSPTNQYRIVRKKKLVGNLPTGIKYVLDLTPPDEGDEAVQLTSELSCSLGIRLWYTAAQRCGISNNLIGGEDEVMDPRNVTSYGAPTVSAPLDDSEFESGTLKNISNQTVNDDGQSTSWQSHEVARQNREIADAVRMSLEELSKSKAKKATKVDPAGVPEYCPIRHRAGIGRLLRVLEGKDPRLDSAPKVWTLFVLAKYFDCTTAVVDWIVSWVIAEPNTQFVEILPEASCKMAFGLNNQMICRAAFSILVSEEALSLASREIGRIDADRKGTNQFGRLREDIDEDIRTRIEYASKTFSSRVCKTFEILAEEEMTWVTQLPEYQKLQRFKKVILSCVDNKNNNKHKHNNKEAAKRLSVIDELSFDLRQYVRSRIMASLSSSLTLDHKNSANSHRHAERYTNVDTFNKPDSLFSLFYDKLLDKERIFTRFFWLYILNTDFPIWYNGVRPCDSDLRNRVAYTAGVRPTISALLSSQDRLNESILEAIEKGLFNDGIMPSEILTGDIQSDTSRTYDTQSSSNMPGAMSRVANIDVSHTRKSWNPFAIFKFGSTAQEAPISDDDDWSASMTSDYWKTDSIKSHTDAHWDAWTTNDGADDTKPLIPRKAGKLDPTTKEVSRDTQSANLEKMDVDEYLAQHHLLDPQSGLKKDITSEKGFPVTNSNLPLRPKAQATIAPAEDFATDLDEKYRAIPHTVEPSESQDANAIWTPDEPSLSNQARDKYQPQWKTESYLSYIMREAQIEQPGMKTYPILRPIIEGPRKPSIPSDDKITTRSPLFNMSNLFAEAKNHIRNIATEMLDQREMGFDVTLTDTLLCLGPEEFKYLPLWAGGDDDGSGGVFDDAIPFPLAGPNGPGPSFHTGFSSASAASSEYDTMSDRTAFNTSVAVEDGFSDHIDRRIVVADDDFHSETFSEDSEVYDRKGKGVDRSGFYTSAPTSEAALSMAETTHDSVPNIEFSDNSSFEMEYEEDNSDADTTVGQVDDEDGDEVWDGGDIESFDFGDSDDEMANV